MVVSKPLLHDWRAEKGVAGRGGEGLVWINSEISAGRSERIFHPARRCVILEGSGGVCYVDISCELVKVADKGKPRSVWKDQTVDDEELRLEN